MINFYGKKGQGKKTGENMSSEVTHWFFETAVWLYCRIPEWFGMKETLKVTQF